MKTAHDAIAPGRITDADRSNGYWTCPVCGEPYSVLALAQECLDSHYLPRDDDWAKQLAANAYCASIDGIGIIE